ncbi:transferase [Clostridium paraputrificum]|uniref:Acetyltransferase EpsM n=1 Tax=Clostridium paraputrificum TaxID=29363 RepID=A0A6N3DHY7_9CLOT
MKDILIVGAGGFGREVAWLIEEINEKISEWNILGFIDENEAMYGEELNGYKVLGGIDKLEDFKNVYIAIAIGNSKVRKDVVRKISKFDCKQATLIHPNVIMDKKSNSIGKGCIICASNIITVNVNIGNYVIINLDSTVGHDVVLKDFVTIYPSVNVSGCCTIGQCVELGTGSQIIQGKNIGDYSIIGAGSVVIKNIDSNRTAVGVPAIIKK